MSWQRLFQHSTSSLLWYGARPVKSWHLYTTRGATKTPRAPKNPKGPPPKHHLKDLLGLELAALGLEEKSNRFWPSCFRLFYAVYDSLSFCKQNTSSVATSPLSFAKGLQHIRNGKCLTFAETVMNGLNVGERLIAASLTEAIRFLKEAE